MNDRAVFSEYQEEVFDEGEVLSDEEVPIFVPNFDDFFNPNEEFEEISSSYSVDESFSKRYRSSMNKSLQVHRRKFNVGDEVFLALDFDNNPSTKRKPFQSFFSEETYSVIEVLSDDSVLLENSQKTWSGSVSTTRIKKVKK
jgi:hypothetical protein